MRHVLVRYSEIGTKSKTVRRKMRHLLRQRVADRLSYEGTEFESVASKEGRVIVRTQETGEAARHISEVPGVASVSPALKTEADIESIKRASENFKYGDSFAVEANRAGEHSFSSRDIKQRLGAYIEDLAGSHVDLDSPETTLGIDVRFEDAYLFDSRLEGPGGLPVGSQDSLAALISGGIDSPVAAYQVMKRGADIIPVYFFNRPIAAEDHLIRFESALEKLRKFHPAKKWYYYRVDLEEANQELLEMGRGRMVLHRILMFRVAERIAEDEGLEGIVTGESMGQKSSQTASILRSTSREIEMPVHRPLLGWNKSQITEAARQIGTFEDAKIDSACRSLSPDHAATSMKSQEIKNLKQEIELQGLVEEAYTTAEKVNLKNQKV